MSNDAKTNDVTPGVKTLLTDALHRRDVLRVGAGAAATMVAARALSPSGVFAQGAGPETTKATLGYIALTDSAPLIVAKEKGFYAKYGMTDVTVTKQASWGTTRDNMVLGSEGNGIDGAHILSPMPYLIAAGKVTQQNIPLPMYILARLNYDAQGISVGMAYKDLKPTVDAKPLKETFLKMKASGKQAKVAMTFPGGNHDLWIRYWLAAAGIDPDKDVETIVVPPPQMVANMKVGTMDAFCVGEPWPGQLVGQGIGFTACNTSEIWQDHPEKSFAMRASYVDKNPIATKALLAAVMEAQMFCEDPANKDEVAAIVGTRAWFNVPVKDILGRLKGEYDYGDGRTVSNSPGIMKFWGDGAVSYPYQSHDLWFLTEDSRWGKYAPGTDLKGMIAKVNREDLWKEAAKTVGAKTIPSSTSRGVETFFDGKTFDPANPSAYLESLEIKRVA